MSTPAEEPIDALQLAAERLTTSAIKVVRSLLAFTGIVAVAMGIILLVWPGKTMKVVAVLMGVYFLVIAVMRLWAGITAKGLPAGWRVLDLFMALLLLLGGVFMVRNSALAGATLVLAIVIVVGVLWIFEGVLALVESGKHPNSGWSIAFGLLSILAGIIVIATPSWSAAALFVFTGVMLVITGITAIFRAVRFGKEALAALD